MVATPAGRPVSLPSPEDPVVTYECPHGSDHPIPSPDVRVLKCGDAGFIVACDCGPEPLAETDTSPHPETDHLVNIYREDPNAAEWLALESIADAWYDVEPHRPPEGFDGTRAQRRARYHERMVEQVEGEDDPQDGSASEREQDARAVPCPACGASADRKCQRPSGHRVRTVHADRVDHAEAAGVLDSDGKKSADTEQVCLDHGGWD